MAHELKVLGSRLHECREQAKLTVAQLAERSDLSVGDLESFEQGMSSLGMAGVVRLARVLGVPRGSFLHSSAPAPRAFEAPDVMLWSRGTASMLEEDVKALERGLVRARSFLEALDLPERPTLSGDEPLFRTGLASGPEPYVEGYERARGTRLRLAEALPARAPLAAPVRDLGRLIEDHLGILVIDLPFASKGVAEASCRLGSARLIAVDPRRPETTRRWAFAHGLAHQLLDLTEEDALQEEPDESFSLEKNSREKRADAFAAMFLAPREAVERVLGARQIRELGEARGAVESCRRHLGLNFVPMARQLQNLNVFSKETADGLVFTASTEAVEGLEEPRRHDGLARRVFEALHGGGISRGRARELLGLSIDEDSVLDAALRG